VPSIVSILVKILEAFFIFGLLGSAAVLVLTSIEDIKEFVLRDQDHEPPRSKERISTPERLAGTHS
jgi:hypothetical protein